MTSNIFHFPFVAALHAPTVRCVLVIAQGNFRFGATVRLQPETDAKVGIMATLGFQWKSAVCRVLV